MHYNQLEEPHTSLDELQNHIGYQFRDINLLKQALTRQSAIEERIQSRAIGSFQRLEFLGDKVLNLSVSQLLFHYHPEWPEGKLTQETARFVNNQGPLCTIGRNWGLGKLLIVGRGEQMQNIKDNNKALGDAVEAILGAIFEDSDSDYKLVKKLIARHWVKVGLMKTDKLISAISTTSTESETLADIIFSENSQLQRQKIRLILKHGVSKKDLEYAIMNSYQEIDLLKMFCAEKADSATLNYVLCQSIRESLVPQVQLLLASGAEANSVHECSDEYWSGDVPCIGDPYTNSALQLAVGTYGDQAILMTTELLRYGADANWQEGRMQITKYHKRHMSIAELLNNPPQVEIKENKITALHIVVRGDNNNKKELIRLLIKQGSANPDLGDTDGNTPLHDAAYNCYLDTSIYDLLVLLGANENQANNNHQTPRQLRQLSLNSWEKSITSMRESMNTHQLLFSIINQKKNKSEVQTATENPVTSPASAKAPISNDTRQGSKP